MKTGSKKQIEKKTTIYNELEMNYKEYEDFVKAIKEKEKNNNKTMKLKLKKYGIV